MKKIKNFFSIIFNDFINEVLKPFIVGSIATAILICIFTLAGYLVSLVRHNQDILSNLYDGAIIVVLLYVIAFIIHKIWHYLYYVWLRSD